MKLSIITCFYNSAERLPRYFEAVRQLERMGLDCELILVDNASRDSTLALLQQAAGLMPLPTKVLSQPQPGLMYARCMGIDAATGSHAVFFDDDNEPRSDYLQSLARLIQRFPKAVAFTGNSVLPAEYVVEAGLRPALPMLALRNVPGEHVLVMDRYCPQPMPWGAGLGVRVREMREACDAWLKTARVIVGRTGDQPIGGEEVWLVHHMTRSGEVAVFSDTLHLTHRIALHRLTADYLGRLGYEYGVVQPALIDAVRAFKPEVRFLYPSGVRGVLIALVRATIEVLRYCLQPSGGRYAFAAGRLGLVIALIRRHQLQGIAGKPNRTTP